MFELHVYHYRVISSNGNVLTYSRKYSYKTVPGLLCALRRFHFSERFVDAIIFLPTKFGSSCRCHVRLLGELFEPSFVHFYDTLKTFDFVKRSDSNMTYNERLCMEFSKNANKQK